MSAPTRDSAHQLAQELRPELREEGGRWKIAAPEDVVLSESRMTARRTEFSSLAGNFGGQYHGWAIKAKESKTVNPG